MNVIWVLTRDFSWRLFQVSVRISLRIWKYVQFGFKYDILLRWMTYSRFKVIHWTKTDCQMRSKVMQLSSIDVSDEYINTLTQIHMTDN